MGERKQGQNPSGKIELLLPSGQSWLRVVLPQVNLEKSCDNHHKAIGWLTFVVY